jgi:hypothetical protein
MSEPDPKTTLRELHEYFVRSYEPQNKLAAPHSRDALDAPARR